MSVRPRTRRRGISPARIVIVVVAALASGVAASTLGLTPAVAIAIALLVAAGGAAWIGMPVEQVAATPIEHPSGRAGARPDVAQLTWALAPRGGGVGSSGLDRVRLYARDRLARRGIDPDDPGARPELERMFGPAGFMVLTSTGRRRVTLRGIEHCLDVLDALDGSGSPAAADPATEPRTTDTRTAETTGSRP